MSRSVFIPFSVSRQNGLTILFHYHYTPLPQPGSRQTACVKGSEIKGLHCCGKFW
jgi:hypothetical protein